VKLQKHQDQDFKLKTQNQFMKDIQEAIFKKSTAATLLFRFRLDGFQLNPMETLFGRNEATQCSALQD